jgi:hypothetical protein
MISGRRVFELVKTMIAIRMVRVMMVMNRVGCEKIGPDHAGSDAGGEIVQGGRAEDDGDQPLFAV